MVLQAIYLKHLKPKTKKSTCCNLTPRLSLRQGSDSAIQLMKSFGEVLPKPTELYSVDIGVAAMDDRATLKNNLGQGFTRSQHDIVS